MADSCEYGNELPGYINKRYFFLLDEQLLASKE